MNYYHYNYQNNHNNIHNINRNPTNQNLTPPIIRLVKNDPQLGYSNSNKPKMKVSRRPSPSAPLPTLKIPSSLFEPNSVYGRFQDFDAKSNHTTNTQFSTNSKHNNNNNNNNNNNQNIIPRELENYYRSKRRIRSQNYDHYLNSNNKVEENTVMKWIQSFKMFGKNTSKSELGEIMSSGVKLCEFVSYLFKQEIPGVAKNPKSNAAAISNINRALQVLREQKSMPPRFLWSTKEILNGDNKVVFGLLSDIMEGLGKKPKRKSTTKTSSTTSAPTTESSSDIISSTIPSPKAGQNGSQTAMTSTTKHKDIENVVKRWLHDRNLDVLLEKDSQENILADPLRNGIVAEKMVSILEGRKIALPHSRPRSLRQVKENLNSIIATVRSSRPLPPDLQASASKIIKGSTNTLWRLLYYIIHAYDGSETTEKGYSGSSIYKADEMLKLEKSVVEWLERTGIIPENSSIDIVMAGMQSGTLLCELVPLISGSRVIGVHRNAKTPSLAFSNIRRGMETLAACKKMSRRFLVPERQKELLNGNKNVVLGLLEDVRRCYDGEPPLKGQPAKPYLGKTMENKKDSKSQKDERDNNVDPQNLLIPATPPTELRPDYPAPAQLPNLNFNPPDFELYPEAFMPTWEPSSQLLPAPDQMMQTMEAKRGINNDGYQDISKTNTTEVKTNVIEPAPHVKTVHKWVQSLDFNVLDHPQISLEKDFCDGVLLCNIVEKVFPNAKLNGITSSCRSSAARLFNIRKALQYLGEQKVISEEMVLQDEAVLNGNVEHIASLLQKIRNVHRRQQQLTLFQYMLQYLFR